MPDAPTAAESGYSGIEGVIWYGVSGPPGIPKPVVARTSGELAKLLALPEVKERFGQQGAIRHR